MTAVRVVLATALCTATGLVASLPATAARPSPAPGGGPAAAATQDRTAVALRDRGPRPPFDRTDGRSAGAAPWTDPAADRARQRALDTLRRDGATGAIARVSTTRDDWSGGAGRREAGRPVAARGNESFRVASNTKPMVATLVMQLVEDGTWTLDTRVEEVLPGLLPGREDVTVRQLLQHTSGMPTGNDAAAAARMEDPASWAEFFEVVGQHYDPEDLVAGALATPWLFTPGTDWSYSNAGYVTLGMMLEEETGQSLGRLLERRVFGPARMSTARYETGPRIRGSFLVGSTATPDGTYTERGFDPTHFGAAGAVSATTRDLNRFSKALVDGRLVEKATVRLMTTPGDNPLAYGLGTYRVPDPCSPKGAPRYLVGHDGGAYGTTSLMLTSEDGRRQVSLAATGREIGEQGVTQRYDIGDALVRLMATAC